MKNKFSSFLVAERKAILIIFIIMALGFGAMIPFVHVNYDMTKYMPDDSSMRQGLDIMEAEFGEENSSKLIVMFDDLKNKDEKKEVLKELESIKYVESVDYKLKDSEYNKGKYTRFVLNSEHEQHSKAAASIWDTVRDKYEKNHNLSYGGSISEANDARLPLWIVIVAVALIFLILLIMANSYIEPLAFLITIGIAVLINMGSYIFFKSISDTTFGIVAILQLVLSMDYSIMLLNRYRQVRVIEKDKIQAMKEALNLSFGAITGSSLTTFAGLLALLFMSFKMGADIGVALAKGVIISLICIFTVLPALLIAFDELMIKTKKKTLSFNLPRLSRFQFRFRVPLTLLFAAVFAFAFFARGNVDFSYSQAKETEVNKIFGYDNSIVMMYNIKDGKAAEKLSEELERNDAVTSAACFEGTLGKERTAGSMKDFIDDMNESESTDIDFNKDMIKLIYYTCFAGDRKLKMTIPTFVDFLKNDVMRDENFSDYIDADAEKSIDKMDKFMHREKLVRPMNAAELADFFGMKKSQAKKLLMYYQIKSGSSAGKMTLPGFVSFLVNDVSKDRKYKSMFDSATLKKLKSMQKFTRKKTVTSPRSYTSAAKVMGMDSSKLRLIYVNYFSQHGKKGTMTIETLASTLTVMSSDPELKDRFPEEQISQLVAGLTQIAAMDKNSYSTKDMAKALSGYGMPLDEDTLKLVYSYDKVTVSGKNCSMSIQKLISYMLSDKSISSSLTKDRKSELAMLKKIMDISVSGKKLSASDMGKLLGMKTSDVRSIYILNISKYGTTYGWKLSPQKFVDFLVNVVLKDKKLNGQIGNSAKDLKTAKKLIDSVVDRTKYTSGKLAEFFADYNKDMDKNSVEMLYRFYGAKKKYNKSWKMSLVQMVHYLDENVSKDELYSEMIDDDMRDDIHDMREDLDEGAKLLEGEKYGRMLISSHYPEDSEETRAFMKQLEKDADDSFSHDTYLIGNTPMAYETSRTFKGELNKITIITALFILLIVLLTFRRLTTPIVLVLIIQCAVFVTMGVLSLINFDMHYLALLIVQSIMMGATIDYAIIYSTYYVEKRRVMAPEDAIKASYKGSLQTILTSATILIAAVGLLSFAFTEEAISQICRILSLGCLSATLLVIFVLPGIMACLDRLIVKKIN